MPPCRPATSPARRKARKRALDVLYQADLRGAASIRETLEDYLARVEEPEAGALIWGYTVRGWWRAWPPTRSGSDQAISSLYAEGWTLERMPVVDRNLARIAVFEILYADDIDSPVAITEAVEVVVRRPPTTRRATSTACSAGSPNTGA